MDLFDELRCRGAEFVGGVAQAPAVRRRAPGRSTCIARGSSKALPAKPEIGSFLVGTVNHNEIIIDDAGAAAISHPSFCSVACQERQRAE